jgi:hypothetical protein
MRDTAEDRCKIIEQLELALAGAAELNESALAYLIERAIDEARAGAWPMLNDGRPSTGKRA